LNLIRADYNIAIPLCPSFRQAGDISNYRLYLLAEVWTGLNISSSRDNSTGIIENRPHPEDRGNIVVGSS
jgi:hypothetical protein